MTPTSFRGWGLVLAGLVCGLLPTARGDDEVLKRKSPAGRIFIAANMGAKEGLSLVAIDPETGKWMTVFDGCPVQARVSPDGRTVVYSQGNMLWTRSLAAGGEPKQLVDLAGPANVMPVWSGDGKRLLLSIPGTNPTDNRLNYLNIRVDADGKGVTELPVPKNSYIYDWSADGTWIVTRTLRKDGSGYEPLVMHPDGTGVHSVAEDGAPVVPRYPRFSPDGRRLAYGSQNKVFVVDTDGKNHRKVCTLGAEGTVLAAYPCWSPDGKRLAVHSRSRNRQQGNALQNRIEVMDLDGRRVALFELPDGVGGLAPDWR